MAGAGPARVILRLTCWLQGAAAARPSCVSGFVRHISAVANAARACWLNTVASCYDRVGVR